MAAVKVGDQPVECGLIQQVAANIGHIQFAYPQVYKGAIGVAAHLGVKPRADGAGKGGFRLGICDMVMFDIAARDQLLPVQRLEPVIADFGGPAGVAATGKAEFAARHLKARHQQGFIDNTHRSGGFGHAVNFA